MMQAASLVVQDFDFFSSLLLNTDEGETFNTAFQAGRPGAGHRSVREPRISEGTPLPRAVSLAAGGPVFELFDRSTSPYPCVSREPVFNLIPLSRD